MKRLIDILDEGGYSCVIAQGDHIRTFTRRGVADLYDLLQEDAAFLHDASVADKVIGKAAAQRTHNQPTGSPAVAGSRHPRPI